MLALLQSHSLEVQASHCAVARFVVENIASKAVAEYLSLACCLAVRPIEPSAYSSRHLAHRPSCGLADLLVQVYWYR